MLLLPEASVNVPAATSIVVAPLAVGVKVAVWTVDQTAAKLLRAPWLTVQYPAAKVEVAALYVNF